MKTIRSWHVFGAALALVMTWSARAGAETNTCTAIAALPAVISAQGIYCLTANLSTGMTSGNAITVTANNVTIDLNGWKLGGQAAGTGTSTVGVSSSASNVTVRNGIVRGFRKGLQLSGSGALVEGLVVDFNTSTAVEVDGDSSIVRNNQILNTGGATISADESAYGILVQGTGTLVDGNLVSGLTSGGSNAAEYAIYLGSAASDCTVRNNVVSDNTAPASASPLLFWAGIRMGNSTRVAVIGNSVTGFTTGRGIYYFGTATGVYSRNTVVGAAEPFVGGTAGSGNDS